MPKEPVKSILKGTGALVSEIPFESIHANTSVSVTKENLMTLTSYNLLEKRRRTIIVPGSPPIWTPKPLPVNIKPDSGRSISDPARHVFPKSPLEPLFRALFTTRPDFNIKGVDLVTDRRNLRLLLDFVGGAGGEFRIDVEVLGSTVLFSRWSPNPVSYLNTFGGYGHEFENAFTRYGNSVKGSISYNCAITYNLGGVQVIMRFEVDGYIGGALPTPTGPAQGTYTGPSNALMKSSNAPQTPTGYSVSVRGQFIAPARTIEIKTGGAGKNLFSKAKAQMWFSQTPILCAGNYTEPGVFDSVTEVDMVQNGKLAEWERGNKEKLQKLVRVIEMICEVVKRAPGGKCVIVHTGGSKVLKVLNVINGGNSGLPADIVAKLKA